MMRISKPMGNMASPTNPRMNSGGEPIAIGLVQDSFNVNVTRLSALLLVLLKVKT
jgi:hypothetical protein